MASSEFDNFILPDNRRSSKLGLQILGWGIHFFSIWLVVIVGFGLIAETAPSSIRWLIDSTWDVAALTSLTITGLSIAISLFNRKPFVTMKFSAPIGASLIAVTILGIYLLSSVANSIHPPNEIVLTLDPTMQFIQKRNEVATLTAPLGLNDNQREDVETLLTDQGYITQDDLKDLGLTETQIEAIGGILREWGYMTQDDALSLFQQESTAAAAMETATASAVFATARALAATATAQAPECYITPVGGLSDVRVRNSPSNSGENNKIGFLYAGHRLRVVAHNGGEFNNDLWWVVEFPLNGELVDGWILSSVVEEINLNTCINLPQARGT